MCKKSSEFESLVIPRQVLAAPAQKGKDHSSPLLSRETLVSVHMERKVSQASQGQRVVPVDPVSLVSAMLEHPACVERLECLVYLGCQGHQVYPDQKVSYVG